MTTYTIEQLPSDRFDRPAWVTHRVIGPNGKPARFRGRRCCHGSLQQCETWVRWFEAQRARASLRVIEGGTR
jgi:hypothetical protein